MSIIFLSLETPKIDGEYAIGEEAEVKCPAKIEDCQFGSHPVIWFVIRRPVDQMGHFMVFSLNGERTAIDASLPTRVSRIPRDALIVPRDIAAKAWHDTSGSHCFGDVIFDWCRARYKKEMSIVGKIGEPRRA